MSVMFPDQWRSLPMGAISEDNTTLKFVHQYGVGLHTTDGKIRLGTLYDEHEK
jgi:hypothetical protein